MPSMVLPAEYCQLTTLPARELRPLNRTPRTGRFFKSYDGIVDHCYFAWDTLPALHREPRLRLCTVQAQRLGRRLLQFARLPQHAPVRDPNTRDHQTQ